MIPEGVKAAHGGDEDARPWLEALPEMAAGYLDRWHLQLDGQPAHGGASLVLPVTRQDGSGAMLKLQPLNDENVGEAIGLRTWDGDGAVRVFADDPATGTILLERLDAERPLSTLADDVQAIQILSELLLRLSAVRAPEGMRRLADIVAEMVDETPAAVTALRDPADRKLVRRCAAAVAELLNEAGDRLLHWDLHYDNVLASFDREPWLAIDPKPIAGDPAFELFPALGNRWDDVIATGDVTRAVRRRFDLMTEVLGLDRQRAIGWTLGRILQNALWDVEDGENAVDPTQVAIAHALL